MAWNDAGELFVGQTGQVYVAPVGTALPTAPDGTLNSAFVGLGYHTEDGVSLSVDPDIQEFMAWQSRTPVRRELNTQGITASWTLQQWNENNVPLAFGGGTVTALGGGGYRYDFPEDEDALDERSVVIDAVDGDDKMRFVIPRCNVTEAVETNFQRSETAQLPITVAALEPEDGGAQAYLLTDSAAFAAGS